MVSQIPDPPIEKYEEITEDELNNVELPADSDSDEGPLEIAYDGYAPLSVDPDQALSSDSEDEQTESAPSNSSVGLPENLPDISNLNVTKDSEIAQLWNTPRTGENPMDSEHAAKVLKAMEGFSLPESATPSWAANMTDDQWRTHITEKILKK